MKSLAQIYEECRNGTPWPDKGTVHCYIEVYEQLLAPYRLTAKRVLEIGILTGASLRMLESYFFQSEVHGVDLCDRPLDIGDLRPMIAEGTHHISLLNACDPAQVEANFTGMTFDVIIEDANHVFADQMAMYTNFKSKLAPDGLYVIEDVGTIDETRPAFEKIDPERRVRILDLRHVKGRFDDVLVVIGGKDV